MRVLLWLLLTGCSVSGSGGTANPETTTEDTDAVTVPADTSAGPSATTPFALIVGVDDATADASGTCMALSPVGSAELMVAFDLLEE
jgi:hypothetical protein